MSDCAIDDWSGHAFMSPVMMRFSGCAAAHPVTSCRLRQAQRLSRRDRGASRSGVIVAAVDGDARAMPTLRSAFA